MTTKPDNLHLDDPLRESAHSAGAPLPAAPIRLALCITELEVGGAERCLVELATRLDPREFAPCVISLGPPPSDRRDPDAGQLVRQLQAAGVPLFFLNARGVFDAPRTLARLTRLLRQQRPSVVQTFLYHANVLGAMAARLAGLRSIVAGIRVAERENRIRLATLRGVDRWVERHVCVSESVAEFSAAEGRLPRRKLLVIPNGVDLERFRNIIPSVPQSLGVAAGRRLIVCVGRLERQKGVDRLLAAAPKFLAALPDHDLVIVGRGPQHDRLAALARQSGFGTRIHLVGWRPDAIGILAAADVVVALSRWEGMSNVLLEAMACGKPVVATRVEGVAELLSPHDSQQAIAEEQLAEAPDRVIDICRNANLQKELGDGNRARVERHFSLAAMVDRYAQLYREHSRSRDSAP